MLLFAVMVEGNKFLKPFIKETNYRFDGGDGTNKALTFVSGKITPVKKGKDFLLIFNIRLMMFNFRFMKHLILFAFIKGLRKKGYKGRKPKMLDSVTLFHELEVLL